MVNQAFKNEQPLIRDGGNERESVLFIGTQFSILYISMYSPAEAGLRVLDVCGSV